MADISLGNAIGLQYRMPNSDRAVSSLERIRAEGDEAFRRAQKAMLTAQEDREKYKENFNKWEIDKANGIDEMYYPDIKAKADKIRQYMIDNKDFANRPEFHKLKFDLAHIFDVTGQSTKNMKEDMQKAYYNSDKFEGRKEYLEAIQEHNLDKLKDAQKKYGIQSVTDYYSPGMMLDNKLKDVDWLGSIMKNAKGGTYETQEGAKGTSSQVKEAQYNAWKTSDPKAYNAAVTNFGLSLSPEKADLSVKDLFFKQYDSSAAPLKKDGGEEVLTAEDIKTKIPITKNLTEIGKAFIGESGKAEIPKTIKRVEDVAHYGLTLPSNVTLNIPSSKYVIDRNTGEKIDYIGQLNVSGGQILSNKVQENGKEKYVPYLYATTSYVTVDEDGKEKTIKKDVEIPLSALRGQKVLEKHKKAIDEIERKTEELNKEKKSYTKSQLQKMAENAGYAYDEYYQLVKDKIQLK